MNPKCFVFFSGDKIFDQNQKVNRRNDRWLWLCQDPADVSHIMHTTLAATVMVIRVFSNKGDVMPLHFFEKRLRVNAEE